MTGSFSILFQPLQHRLHQFFTVYCQFRCRHLHQIFLLCQLFPVMIQIRCQFLQHFPKNIFINHIAVYQIAHTVCKPCFLFRDNPLNHFQTAYRFIRPEQPFYRRTVRGVANRTKHRRFPGQYTCHHSRPGSSGYRQCRRQCGSYSSPGNSTHTGTQIIQWFQLTPH